MSMQLGLRDGYGHLAFSKGRRRKPCPSLISPIFSPFPWEGGGGTGEQAETQFIGVLPVSNSTFSNFVIQSKIMAGHIVVPGNWISRSPPPEEHPESTGSNRGWRSH
jgi:hypothetical protein